MSVKNIAYDSNKTLVKSVGLVHKLGSFSIFMTKVLVESQLLDKCCFNVIGYHLHMCGDRNISILVRFLLVPFPKGKKYRRRQTFYDFAPVVVSEYNKLDI